MKLTIDAATNLFKIKCACRVNFSLFSKCELALVVLGWENWVNWWWARGGRPEGTRCGWGSWWGFFVCHRTSKNLQNGARLFLHVCLFSAGV